MRIRYVKGAPLEAGRSLGEALGGRLIENIDRYIKFGPAQHANLDRHRLQAGALPWLRRLPQRFQEELEGLAQGANIPLQRVAEWCFVDALVSGGCTGLICLINGRAWVARNNDFWVPDLWGYVTAREIAGRIPRIDFGMEGDVFTSTGVNQEGLWLHWHWLPALDAPPAGRPHMPCFVFVSEALETCRSLQDVEALLSEVNRDGSMMLFAVDGKTDEFALFECTCTRHHRRAVSAGRVIGTNHYCTTDGGVEQEEARMGSRQRYRRTETLLAALAQRDDLDVPRELIRILADDGVEARGTGLGTVCATVACPSQREIWYTFGGYPASSAGRWQQVQWPWPGTQSPSVREGC